MFLSPPDLVSVPYVGYYWARLAGMLSRLLHRLLFVRHALLIYVDDLIISLLSGPSAPCRTGTGPAMVPEWEGP